MLLHERFRKFPVKFYKDLATGKIIYESGFTQGEADTLNQAFSEFSRSDFTKDLFYYYDDVMDAKVGQYIPAIKETVRKNRKYLGKLEIELDIQSQSGNDKEKEVAYLSKHKEAIPKHLEWIESRKKAERISRVKQNIINGVKNIIKNIFRKNEMFDPVKSTEDLICSHCGSIIPIGTYYEVYRGKSYHLECIWDKLVNKQETNSYQQAEGFFFSLKQYIGNWPGYGLDVEEDYIADLELVEANNRYLKREPLSEDIERLIAKINDLTRNHE